MPGAMKPDPAPTAAPDSRSTLRDWRDSDPSAQAATLAAGPGPIVRALLSLGIFGVVYFGLTLALRHPDAARLWKLAT